ncbi:MAG: glycosyltransferase [Pyrinomonadaceae bacterium]
MRLPRRLITAIETLRQSGPKGLILRYLAWRRSQQLEAQYQQWLVDHGNLSGEEVRAIQLKIDSLVRRPLISVVVPVYNIDEKWLRLCIESVRNQIYTKWELCIADDASTASHVRTVLDEYAAKDDRISVVFRGENGHISAASNSALEIAKGEYIVLLDHDDELSPDALYRVAKTVNAFPDAAIIYSDEDLIDENGRRFGPKFKPDFSRDLFYSLNLMTHLCAYRTEVLRSVGGFRIGLEGSQDYDLELRVLEQIEESQIRHIPRVLYHWRVIRGSVAFSMDEKPYAHEAARNALREHFQRLGIDAEVSASFHNLHRVGYARSGSASATAIVSPVSGDISLAALLHGSIETIVVRDDDQKARAEILNFTAASSAADVLLFLDGNLDPIDEVQAAELVSFAMRPEIGAAGGRILKNKLIVEQTGLVLDSDLRPRNAFAGYARTAPGTMFRNRQIGNFSAISVSCMAIRRELFEQMGGFDVSEERLGVFDADLCLRLWEMGKRVVVLPHVEFVRRGSLPKRKPTPAALAAFQKKWPRYVERDPFCDPNLKRDGSFDIEI